MASFGIALALAAATFPLVVGLAMLSYRFIEQPFLKLRGTYDKPTTSSAAWGTSPPRPLTTQG